MGLFGVFVIYANAESKPAHAQAKPVSMIIVGLENEISEKEKQNLRMYLGGIQGITAVQSSAESKKVSILFEKDAISPEMLVAGIEKIGIDVNPIVFEKPTENTPECPVPAQYIQKLEELKYAFNFRNEK